MRVARRGRTGLLVASLLVLAGVLQPAGPAGASPASSRPGADGSASTGSAWQHEAQTVQDQPRRLAVARHVPAADFGWVVYEPAADGCPPAGRSHAGGAGVAHRGCAAPPPRSSRAPPAGVR